MKNTTICLPINQAGALEEAARSIARGGLIAFPTDTVYGIGTSAFLPQAIERIYQVKGREHTKAIPILAADPSDLETLTPLLPRSAKLLIEHFWPGPLTLIVPLLPGLPENLSSTPTIGVRIPDHQQARALLRITGPLAATSANRSGEPPALTARQVEEKLKDLLDLILDGGTAPGGVASTVVDCTRDEPSLLREGPVGWSEIQASLSALR